MSCLSFCSRNKTWKHHSAQYGWFPIAICYQSILSLPITILNPKYHSCAFWLYMRSDQFYGYTSIWQDSIVLKSNICCVILPLETQEQMDTHSREPRTDKNKGTTKAQLGEAMSLLATYRSMGLGLLTGARTTQRQL